MSPIILVKWGYSVNFNTQKFDTLELFESNNSLNNIIYITDHITEYRANGIEEALNKKIKHSANVSFIENDNNSLSINNKTFKLRDLKQDQAPLINALNVKPKDTIVFDLNSVKLPLLLVILKLLTDSPISRFLFVYGEPRKYSKDNKSNATSKCDIENRNFNLSNACSDFSSIPFASLNLSDETVKGGIVIHGFEGDRLNRLFNKNEGILEKDLIGIFQVPAVKAGWENDSYYGNYSAIEEGKTAFRDFFYCAAYDPLQIYEIIVQYRLSYTKSHNEKIFSVPLGPAPTGLGVVLACIQGKCQGVLYDYPISNDDKSDGINSVYLYEYNKS